MSEDEDALMEVLVDDDETFASVSLFAETDLWAFGLPLFFPVFDDDDDG